MYDLAIKGSDFGPLAAAILDRGHSVRFQAHGSSMLPFIRDGDILYIQPTSKIRRGDVVLRADAAGHIIAHRVMKVLEKSTGAIVITQGDACREPDKMGAVSQILGTVVTAERAGKLMRLDAGIYHWLGLVWLGTSPWSLKLYALLGALRRRIRDYLIY